LGDHLACPEPGKILGLEQFPPSVSVLC
jgi:hypothetical protein